MNSTSLNADSGTINEQPSLPEISLDSGGAINEQPSLPQISQSSTNQSTDVSALVDLSKQQEQSAPLLQQPSTKPVNNQPTTVYAPGSRTTNPSLAREQFSCAEILAGMQVAKEDESIQQKQQPRKRGRPRMNPEAPPMAKRPRGRPRKDGTPPVQRKEKDKAAEMLLMLYQQGPNSSVDQPRKYRKVINVGGVKAVASGANMTTRQGSRHGKKGDNNGGVVIATNGKETQRTST